VLGFFQKLLSGKPPSPPTCSVAQATQVLDSLPPCTQYVVVASEKYSGKYRCEVTVTASDIAPFIKNLCDSTFGGTKESQLARFAMPRWLGRASLNDGKISYLPASFVEIADPYVLNFIKDGIADVYCKECGKSVVDIKSATRHRKVTGPWSEWTDAWRCQAGHLLYTEDHEIHIMRSR
jgi:hypothetical protein